VWLLGDTGAVTDSLTLTGADAGVAKIGTYADTYDVFKYEFGGGDRYIIASQGMNVAAA
jgi:hypothetical protein